MPKLPESRGMTRKQQRVMPQLLEEVDVEEAAEGYAKATEEVE